MEVRFWGTRGSIPASVEAAEVRSKIRAALKKAVEQGLNQDTDIDRFMDEHIPFGERATYGTNTSCVEIRDEESFILCDAGTGLRSFGNHVMQIQNKERPKEFHIVLSHPHWDHIQGFPFFIPALLEGNRITLYGCHQDLEKAFTLQQTPPFFPLEFKNLGADVRFETLTPDREIEIAGFKVTPKQQNHPGVSFGYRFERGGKTVIYSTDSEYKSDNEEDMAPFIAFFEGADLLIFDAQYTFADACTIKKDWGHSNNLIGVEMAHKAGVRHLVLFHQDPGHGDNRLDRLQEDTRKLAGLLMEKEAVQVSIAWDGLTISV